MDTLAAAASCALTGGETVAFGALGGIIGAWAGSAEFPVSQTSSPSGAPAEARRPAARPTTRRRQWTS
jgi:hypothetical protein